MSRSGYSEDCDYLHLYRANVERSLGSKRGQAFLREMATALDSLPVKELVDGDLVRDDGACCALGSVAIARKMNVADIDECEPDDVADAFGIARVMACEIAYENDESGPSLVEVEGPIPPWVDWQSKIFQRRDETPAERWKRMRQWVASQLGQETTP